MGRLLDSSLHLKRTHKLSAAFALPHLVGRFGKFRMAASASLMATQCQLNEAMELLDPPPPSSLTVAGVAKAYDCLLLSAASTTSSIPGGNEHSGQHDQQQNPPTANGSDDHMKQYPLDDSSSWCALQADIYRALLLSAHLLLGMATREESTEHNEKKDDDNGTSACSPDSATGDGTAIVLAPNDVTTLQQTQRPCRLLLLELAGMIRTRQHGGQSRANGGHADWHDDILPRSNFQLLRECFESSHTNPDGSQERLVSLDIDSMEDEICHLSANDGVESRGTIDVSASKDGETEANDDDDADIGFIGFDRKLLEKEENDLLDIAMPIDSEALTTTQSPKKGQKRKRNTSGNTNSLPSGVTKQGCLVLVNSHKFGNEDQGDGEATSSKRYFVKLYRSGVLGIQLVGNKKEDSFQFYLGADNCLCMPRPLGDTFHFSLEGAQRLNSNVRDANLCSVDRKPKLVFKVDEETGGGLAEGFAWVTAITEVANDASKRREHQEKIRQEWSGGGEWRTAANKQQIKTKGTVVV